MYVARESDMSVVEGQDGQWTRAAEVTVVRRWVDPMETEDCNGDGSVGPWEMGVKSELGLEGKLFRAC